MADDPGVFCLGEDVSAKQGGGVFKITSGLTEKYGEHRIRATPISETAITGMGVGLAMEGYRPILEIMFVDFMGVCLDQIYNAIAKNHYMSGGNVRMPIVIKTAGGCIGSGAQHSQCLWGTFAHLPGLKVVAPSNPYDAKGLMASAVESDDPVIFIEHKKLLLTRAEDFSFGADVPPERYTIPLGKAAIVRAGTDLTLATISGSVLPAIAAAERLQTEGISVEVIDLRSVVPLDVETVAESVNRTGKLLVVDEDYLSFGLSAELVTRVIESKVKVNHFLRHAVPDVPIPGALSLENAIVPSEESIYNAARQLSRRV
jgi:pyruvate dehydrogenase E1 component beta subunit